MKTPLPKWAFAILASAALFGSAQTSPAQDRHLRLILPDQQLRNAVGYLPWDDDLRIAGSIGEIQIEALTPLPPGLEIELSGDRTSASLVGTPLEIGEFHFELSAVDSLGRSDVGLIGVRVVEIDPLVLEDPGGDIDRDGVPNLAEHGMNRSPYIPEPRPQMSLEPVDGVPVFTGPANPAATELRRVIEVWDPAFGGWREGATNPPMLTDGTMVARLAHDPQNAGNLLARVQFSLPVTSADELADIIKKLNELREKVEEAEGELEDNPLVEEVRLIELIRTILEQPSEVIDLLKEWIDGELDVLFPPLDDVSDDDIDGLVERVNAELDRHKKVLCYAKQLLEFLAKTTRDQAEKDKIEAAVEQIDRIKKLIETSEDFQAVYDELRRGIEGLQDLLSDAAQDLVLDKLKAFIERQLIKRFGAGAASAILSAATDAFNLIDALIKQGRLEEARALYNLMFFRMLELAHGVGKYHIDCDRWNTDANDPRIQFGECPTGEKVTVQACVRYWVPKPDGAPNEGHFEDVPVRFEDGETTIEKDPFASDYADECGLRFRLDMDDFKTKAGNHPHVHLIMKVRVGDGPVQHVLGGVYRP